ncbi:MAG: hypothetical protein HQL37_11430 [Alphaproteobacteria bacterium]|nr:hypothetical protein [Alphaproteobacteria bacterium]
MNNPLVFALKSNPQQFLKALQVPELEMIVLGCVTVLAQRAKEGDRTAAVALASAYRTIGAVEV